MKDSRKSLIYLTLYFVVIHSLYIVVTLAGGRKPPIFAIIDMVAVYSVFLAVKYAAMRGLVNLTVLDFWVICYLLISVSSFALYFQPGNPASLLAFAYGIHLLVLPVFVFFAVKLVGSERQRVLLKRICYLNLVVVLYGFVMFYFQPEFFTNYLRDNLFAERDLGNDEWVLYSRVQSYFGSSAVGTVSWITLMLFMILDLRGVKRIVIFTCLIASALLSQQRGAILGAIFALTYFVVIKREGAFRKVQFVGATMCVVVGLMILFGYRYKDRMPFDLIEYTKVRVADELILGNPFEERMVSFNKGWEVISEYPLGLGVGANTSGADSAGANPGGQVVDANFLRIWADLGILGFGTFIMIILFALRRALATGEPFAWTLIVLIYCVQALGSNVFDNFYVSHLFWLLLGVIDSLPRRQGTDKVVPKPLLA